MNLKFKVNSVADDASSLLPVPTIWDLNATVTKKLGHIVCVSDGERISLLQYFLHCRELIYWTVDWRLVCANLDC